MTLPGEEKKINYARALDLEVKEVYGAVVRPGYACWVTVWKNDKNEIFLSFIEKRREKNTLWKPMPLEFWESMNLPHGYHTALCNGDKNIVYEHVVLKYRDKDKTWTETGRHVSKYDASFAWTSLGDERFIRGMCNSYSAFDPNEPVVFWTETSSDGGNTWKRGKEFLEGHSGSGSHPHRLKRLKDGTLVVLITHEAAFGPGRERIGRNAKRPYVRQENTAMILLSKDNGETWAGPLTIFPGVLTYEPDFVELPSGDLLFLNSTVQGGPQIRQYVRKTRFGYIPGPVIDVVAGRVPECVVYTQNNLLVGAARCGEYSCSNDEGATWHTITGLPTCEYQPSIVETSDASCLCAWHHGADLPFGESDQYVGTHHFRLEAKLPAATQLDLQRDMDPARQRYTNSYTMTLTAGSKPLAQRNINYEVKIRYKDQPLTGVVTTNNQGQTQINLTEHFKDVVNIHLGYWLKAWFDPQPEDQFTPSRSVEYMAYAITTSKTELGW